MANMTETLDPKTGPGGVKEFLRRRLNEFFGAVLFVMSLFVFMVLATYNAADPSLDVATDRAPSNIGGPPGAVMADLLLQYFGLAAGLLPLVMIVWALKLLLDQPVRKVWVRLMLLPFVMVFAAAALGVLPSAGAFGIHAGIGGAIGGILFDGANPHGIAAAMPGVGHAAPIIAMVLAAVSGLLLLYVLGLTPGEWRGVGRHAGKVAAVSRVGTGAVAKTGWRLGLKSLQWGRAPEDVEDAPVQDFIPAKAPRQPPIRQKDPWSRLEPLPPEVSPQPAPRMTPFFEQAEPTPLPAAAPPAPGPSLDMPVRRNLAPDIVAPKPNAPAPGRRAEELRQPSLDLDPPDAYDLPPLTLLAEPTVSRAIGPSEDALQQNALLLLGVLEDFGVRGEIVKVRPGPVVTLYELEPAPGTKSSRVIGLADDIARSMSAVSVRVAVVPGRNVIGIELPNAKSETVYLRELLASEAFERTGSRLSLVLGKDIGGAPVIADLAKMPHLLIAGTTGSGKSVGINTMILSLLYRLPPDQCKFIMIDPKMLELSIYDGIPHLLAPVVTDPKKAVVALKWTVREMENRYRLMSKLGVRNIDGYNARIAEARTKGEVLMRRIQTGFDAETGEPQFEDQPLDTNPLPFIVVVVDEMADLMLVAGKDIEAAVQRLAQMARAAGIHIIMATQRPSVDVITGTIKANFPTRISFQVTSKIDSRTILGESGAEQLLGRGDMLYMAGGGRITRVHGPFVADGEVESIVNFLKSQAAPDYIEEVTEEAGGEGEAGAMPESEGDGSDDLYDRAVALVCRERKASTSFVQRHLQIGYNRAARIMERMEQESVVSAANHVGKREVLASPPR
jgi:S-DNA-T family DNA segregation ATPase FtsK/SpoIIIE